MQYSLGTPLPGVLFSKRHLWNRHHWQRGEEGGCPAMMVRIFTCQSCQHSAQAVLLELMKDAHALYQLFVRKAKIKESERSVFPSP